MVFIYPRKVVIADPMEEFQSALAEALSPAFQVKCCITGSAALELVDSWAPELLILDLMLPGLDGVSLLRQLAQRERRPLVLVATALISPFVQSALEELGVQYAMLKPCPVQAVAARVQEMAGQLLPSPSVQMCYASAVLSELGLPNGRQGFQHLITGLPLLMRQRDQRLSKELYLTIARANNTSPKGVEKAIRDTIRAGWKSGNREIWQSYFPGCSRCPKNKEFLFRVTDLLMERQQCG